MTTVEQPVDNIRLATGLCTRIPLMVHRSHYQTALMVEHVQKLGLLSPGVQCVVQLLDFLVKWTIKIFSLKPFRAHVTG